MVRLLAILICCCSWCACHQAQILVASPKSDARGDDEFERYLQQKAAQWIGRAAPNFQAQDLQELPVDLSKMQGKVILLNFWFIQCKPCLTEIVSLKELHKQYAEQDVVLLTIAMDQAPALDEFVYERQIPYRIVPNGQNIAQQYQVATFPTTYLIDKKGVVQQVFIGASDWDGTQTYREIKPYLDKLLSY